MSMVMVLTKWGYYSWGHKSKLPKVSRLTDFLLSDSPPYVTAILFCRYNHNCQQLFRFVCKIVSNDQGRCITN